MTVEPENVSDLVQRCTEGDDAAQAELCGVYLHLVQRAVARKLAQLTGVTPLRADIDDIVSEVFERVLRDNCRALSRLNEPRSIKAWLTAIAQNHVIDHARRATSRKRVQDALEQRTGMAGPATPADVAMSMEASAAVSGLLDTLNPQDRLVLLLYYVDGLRYAEIGEILKLNINTVSARIRRAKLKLRALAEEMRYDFQTG